MSTLDIQDVLRAESGAGAHMAHFGHLAGADFAPEKTRTRIRHLFIHPSDYQALVTFINILHLGSVVLC